jgi:hypothetical protein
MMLVRLKQSFIMQYLLTGVSRAATQDPGYLPIMTDPEVMASRSPRFNMGLCETCKTVRPLRSKHCNHCGRCAPPKLLGPSLNMGASFYLVLVQLAIC